MSRRRKAPTGHVYLIHFQTRYRHAGHYLGFATDLEQRLDQHRAGRGARLLEVVGGAGIGWKVVRVWAGDRAFERTLKRRKKAPKRLCPICRGDTAYDDVDERGLRPPGMDGCGA
ncbi:MAG: hypothetical protein BGO49_20735 [Planctomycetales bacterium 71-10]|nr:MAG: hypothetical protein BGO49_20735 [Planctomycetales bacterium 71-10]